MRRLWVTMVLTVVAGCGPSPPRVGNCADEVRRMEAAPELRVQGGTQYHVTARESAKVYLREAADAAARGDVTGCWERLDHARDTLAY